MKFLVKEIRSKEGELHFRRWRLLATPFFSVYVHYIAKSDDDKHPHNHPWNFWALILRGGYIETIEFLVGRRDDYRYAIKEKKRRVGSLSYHSADDFHKIKLLKPTWSLVLVGKKRSEITNDGVKRDSWGYNTSDRGFLGHEEYRQAKREGKL